MTRTHSHRKNRAHHYDHHDREVSPTRERRGSERNTYWEEHLSFFSGFVTVRHPESCQTCCKNALFTSRNGLGVFSGAGECRCDYNPGAYPQELAKLTSDYINNICSRKIVRGLRNASQTIDIKEGSSAACVIGRDEKKIVGTDVGDCGFIVIRSGEIVYWVIYEPEADKFATRLSSSSSSSTVDDGTRFEFGIEMGDWIVMGSFGLWERLHKEDVRDILLSNVRKFRDPVVAECDICEPLKQEKFVGLAEEIANLASSVAGAGEWTSTKHKHHARDELNEISVVVTVVTSVNATHLCPRGFR